MSLAAAAAATHIKALLEAEGAAPQPLHAIVIADIPEGCVNISISVPQDASGGSWVSFGPLTVSGQPVSGLLRPLEVKVRGVRLTPA